jgi:hypothetical protein
LKEGTNSLLIQLVWDGELKMFKIINVGIFTSLKLIGGTYSYMQTWKIFLVLKIPQLGGQDARKAV